MKICIVSQEYPPHVGGGGIGSQSYMKAHGLAKRNHRVTVVTSGGLPDAPDGFTREMDGAVEVHRLSWPELPVPGHHMASTWLAYSTAVAKHLTTLDAMHAFDIVQFPEYAGEGFVYQTDTFEHASARYCVQAHGPLGLLSASVEWPVSGSIDHHVGTFMEKTSLHRAHLLLASSHATARFCSEQYGCDLQRIRVIHSGVDTALFHPMRPPRQTRDSTPRVLFVGKLAANKGFDILVDAVINLKRTFPLIVARCIGKTTGLEFSEAIDRIRRADAASAFEFPGYVNREDLPQHYAWSDFFVGPSIYEPGPGNVYLEAMSCARAVVACASGGAAEAVIHEETGVLVPPGDGAALRDVIYRLASSPTESQRMGKAGRVRALDGFSMDRYISAVEAHYLSSLATEEPTRGVHA